MFHYNPQTADRGLFKNQFLDGLSASGWPIRMWMAYQLLDGLSASGWPTSFWTAYQLLDGLSVSGWHISCSVFCDLSFSFWPIFHSVHTYVRPSVRPSDRLSVRPFVRPSVHSSVLALPFSVGQNSGHMTTGSGPPKTRCPLGGLGTYSPEKF